LYRIKKLVPSKQKLDITRAIYFLLYLLLYYYLLYLY